MKPRSRVSAQPVARFCTLRLTPVGMFCWPGVPSWFESQAWVSKGPVKSGARTSILVAVAVSTFWLTVVPNSTRTDDVLAGKPLPVIVIFGESSWPAFAGEARSKRNSGSTV